jgi:DmsE family decaheme c-type cytochrome
MKRYKCLHVSVLPGLIFALALATAHTAWAADAENTSAKAPRQDMVLKGDAQCTRCHDETEDYPVLSIGKTKHGTLADKRTPTCTSCHGESDTHANKPEGVTERPKPERSFGKLSTTPMAERSSACLTCHQGGNRIHWARSAHSGAEVACSSCHQIHTAQDKARDKRTQTEVCFTCHKEQRAMMRRPSRHPIDEGKVACSDCHNPHGTAGPKQLVRDNVNDTCYTCHMEKRGPFIRTHEPVQEDCSICHNPHGSTNPNLLKIRPPFLCQSCHQATSHHATVPRNGPVVGAPTTEQAVIMARGCVNCHTNIHGSNNAADGSGRGFRR